MKINSQTELSETILQWLRLFGNKITASYCKQEITTHPDYPAITSVVDFLDSGKMAYETVKADASYINEFNYPLLAHIHEPGNQYLEIIGTPADWDIKKEATRHWSGVVLFPEKDTKWKNAENDQSLQAVRKQNILFVIWCSIGLILFFASIYYSPVLLKGLFGFFSLAGVIFSLAAFTATLGIENSTIKHVCGVVSEGGCHRILNKNFRIGHISISPADPAVIYFSTQFIVYLFSTFYPYLFSLLPCLAIIGILVAGASLYAQRIILNQWCALCLGIVTILVLQSVIGIALFQYFTIFGMMAFVSIFLICTSILWPIKTLLKDRILGKSAITELKKWKSDPELFLAQSHTHRSVNTEIWDDDFILGNAEAPILITVVCNPYCPPCAKAHKKLDKLLNHYQGKVKIQIRFLCNPTLPANLMTIAVKAILQQGTKLKNSEKLNEMLTDWFELMDMEEWEKKWPRETTNVFDDQLLKHYEWVKSSEIAYTPTFFVNGKRLSSKYELHDLEKLIPQLFYKMQTV